MSDEKRPSEACPACGGGGAIGTNCPGAIACVVCKGTGLRSAEVSPTSSMIQNDSSEVKASGIPRYRTGRTLGRTIYDGDQLEGLIESKHLATRIVDLLNADREAPGRESPSRTPQENQKVVSEMKDTPEKRATVRLSRFEAFSEAIEELTPLFRTGRENEGNDLGWNAALGRARSRIEDLRGKPPPGMGKAQPKGAKFAAFVEAIGDLDTTVLAQAVPYEPGPSKATQVEEVIKRLRDHVAYWGDPGRLTDEERRVVQGALRGAIAEIQREMLGTEGAKMGIDRDFDRLSDDAPDAASEGAPRSNIARGLRPKAGCCGGASHHTAECTARETDGTAPNASRAAKVQALDEYRERSEAWQRDYIKAADNACEAKTWFQCAHCFMMTLQPEALHYNNDEPPGDVCKAQPAGHKWVRLTPETDSSSVSEALVDEVMKAHQSAWRCQGGASWFDDAAARVAVRAALKRGK